MRGMVKGVEAILRGICLNEIAIHQMRVLSQVDNRKLLKGGMLKYGFR